ncbi:hypothetical protein [Nonomuraea sp. NPDC003709]|uniref:hypothetical protein n=1 Tax=Nonomuraea sp. NPDC003709 TaxID=3154450 RepID=UPI0033B184DA
MFKPSTVFASAILAVTLAAVPLTAGPASAQTTAQTSAQACRSLRVTGGNVAIRDFPFTNGLVLRTLATGTRLTTCELVRGTGANSYPNKCGKRGADWYKVRSGRTTVTGSPFGYVPATCVSVA